MRVIKISIGMFWVISLLTNCQLPTRRTVISTPYQIEQPSGESESVSPRSCVWVLGAGMTDEVFYAAGWISYFLKSEQANFLDQAVGVGFGTYLLVLLSKSDSPHWLEYQLSKLSALESILAERDSWFFNSKFRDFLYDHFSELEQTLSHRSFDQRAVQRPRHHFRAVAPVMEKSQTALPQNASEDVATASVDLIPTDRVLGVAMDRIPIKMVPAWLIHPHATFFSPDPLVPSLYSEGKVQKTASRMSWTALSSDALITRLIADETTTTLLYFPAWVQTDPHPMYSKGIVSQLKEGQAELQKFYRSSSIQVFRPMSVRQRGFGAHRQLFLQGQADAADADLSLCQNNK